MIRYALACSRGHEFESWFPSSQAFEAQQARGLVSCPTCGSAEVAKQIMAPALARAERAPERPAAAHAQPVAEPAGQPMALVSDKERALRAMLRAVREHVVAHADNVGDRFAEEARRMHYGEIEHRAIYGEANLGEAKALLDEGIEVHPLPIVPDDRN
jgi:hypothetical protein